MPLAYGGVLASVSVGPIKMYVWAAVRNGVRYLYAQLYAGWRKRKTVYLGRDVNEVAGRIVSATAELGRTAGWSTAEKTARRLLREFAVVKAVYDALRQKARERGPRGTALTWVRDVIEAVFDLDVVDVDVEVDPLDLAARLEAVEGIIGEVASYVEGLRGRRLEELG
ncbi:MAG: hypothetical protein QXP98_00960 [Thermoproteus sp.]